MASKNDPEITFKTIREAFLELHPKYEKPARLNFLSRYLPALRDDYGIVADRGMAKSKNNKYRFANPLMASRRREDLLIPRGLSVAGRDPDPRLPGS